MQIETIFQNEHLLIVDKPAMTLSVDPRFKEDERVCLSRLLEKEFSIRILPVHRLDFEVSGLILYAKTKEAQTLLSKGFEDKTIQKTYHAFSLASEFEVGKAMEWNSVLLKGKKRTFESPHGKPAKTFAKVVSKDQKYMEWHLTPVTGRSHQLRFEMYKHGVPILGDELYGSKITYSSGIALRAFRLEFHQFPENERVKLGLQNSYELSVIKLI